MNTLAGPSEGCIDLHTPAPGSSCPPPPSSTAQPTDQLEGQLTLWEPEQ